MQPNRLRVFYLSCILCYGLFAAFASTLGKDEFLWTSKKIKSIKNISGLKENLPENLKCFFLEYSDEDLVSMARNHTIHYVHSIGPLREAALLDYLDDYLYDRNYNGYPVINFISRLVETDVFSNAEYEFRRGWITFERTIG